MHEHGRFPVSAGSTPLIKVVLKEMNLMDELDSIPVEDLATQLTLHSLSEELVWAEGLDNYEDNSFDEENTMIIPIDNLEE